MLLMVKEKLNLELNASLIVPLHHEIQIVIVL
jgi:hypothetical protein